MKIFAGCPSSKSGSLSGSFASPRYPKKTPRLKRCSWGITVPSGYRIQLVFNNFNTEERHRSNILKIYDGPSSSSRAIAFMNRQNSWGPVFSSGTSLWFDFWSGYERRKAFRATYTAIRLHSGMWTTDPINIVFNIVSGHGDISSAMKM